MTGSFDISSNIFTSIPVTFSVTSVTFSVTSVTCFSLIKDFRYIFTRKSPSKSISSGSGKPYSVHSRNLLGMPVPHFSIIFIYANAFAIAGFVPTNKLYYHLSLSFFEKIRLPDIPNDIPRHIPIPIPAMLFNEFIKTTLQSTAAIIPTVIPIIILLHFMSLSSSARLVNTFYFHI